MNWMSVFIIFMVISCVPVNKLDNLERGAYEVASSDGCVPNSVEIWGCTAEVSNASMATRKKVCNPDGQSYTFHTCTIIRCLPGFDLDQNQCKGQSVQICQPGSHTNVICSDSINYAVNAIRQDTCNNEGTGYIAGTCQLLQCQSGYSSDNNRCVKDAVVPVESNLNYIADYRVAKESVLRSIPRDYIDRAREDLVIAYQHTSHGTHVSRGLFGLQDYKEGDNQLFGISTSKESGKLDFRDYAISMYRAPGTDASDLSRNETAFIAATRNYLNHSNNSDVNVVMWSWCDISGHDVAQNYLPGMRTLINEYGAGGSNARAGSNPVTFILMTGHATAGNNVGVGRPADQAQLITEFCKSNSLYCLDYYSIDSHDMDDNYWEDASDDGGSTRYGGNFYKDYQDTHQLGVHWFNNKSSPGGVVEFGAHNSQHITANRKAFAMWYILARIAGWSGK